jgi:surface protein
MQIPPTFDISGWDTSSVTDMRSVFQQCSSFNADLKGWNTAAVTNNMGMFQQVLLQYCTTRAGSLDERRVLLT